MRESNRARTKGTTVNKLYTRGTYVCTYVRRCLREIDGAWNERVSSLQKNPRAPSARNSADPLQGCRLLIMRASDARCLLTVNARARARGCTVWVWIRFASERVRAYLQQKKHSIIKTVQLVTYTDAAWQGHDVAVISIGRDSLTRGDPSALRFSHARPCTTTRLTNWQYNDAGIIQRKIIISELLLPMDSVSAQDEKIHASWESKINKQTVFLFC